MLRYTATALFFIVGCGGTELEERDEPAEVIGSAENGKDDTVGRRDLEWINAGEVELEGTEHLGVAEIASVTESTVQVKSERVVVGRLDGRILEASIAPVGFLSGLSQAVAFAVFVRDSNDKPWTVYAIPGVIQGHEVEAFTFDSIRIDPSRQRVELRIVFPTPSGLRVDAHEAQMDVLPGTEVALVPYPLGAWGELEGLYEFDLDASCDAAACQRR